MATMLSQKLVEAQEANDTVSYCCYCSEASQTRHLVTIILFSHKYEVEWMELKGKISSLRKRLLEMDSAQKGRDAFLVAIRKFMEMKRLTALLLRELIDHIDVYETEGTGKNRTQRVVIHYRFVGYLELPENVFKQSYKADTRQGVSVEYLRSPVTA